MNDIIKTQSIGSGIADVEEDFILSEEPLSRLIFHAQIHNKGIRGRLIRQRRESNNDIWVPEKAIDIRTLGKNETINLELDTQVVSRLYLAIEELSSILKQRGIEYGSRSYAIVDPNSVVITDQNKKVYINKLLEAGYDKDVWQSLVETNPNLVKKLSNSKIQENKKIVLEELVSRLNLDKYLETSGDNSWQQWIYKNNWLFGINYNKPIEKTKINLVGVMPDFIFPTIDGFVDILEIKLPNNDVIKEDESHKGSWSLSVETNRAIGQVINYLTEIDRLKLEIEKQVKLKYGFEISFLKPRAYILIGNSSGWTNDKKEGLRKLNYFLHNIQIITYNELLERGNQSIKSID